MEKERQSMRRTDRVTVAIPVEVTGTEAGGGGFFDRTETQRISRHGASLVLRRKLAPDQELTLRNLENQREAEVTVIGQIGTTEQGELYGVAFTSGSESESLWDIAFPLVAEFDDAAFRIVMGCVACKTREVAYLNELEAEVFQASGVLRRNCARCRQSTVWRESAGPEPEQVAHVETARPGATASAGPASPPRATTQAAPQAMALADAIGSVRDVHEADEAPAEPRTQNDRKHGRSRLKITVCIRTFHDAKDRWGAEEEVIETSDVSRGGFGFSSETRYRKGSHVEVAIPYRAGSANIFVAAKVANVRTLKDGRRRYGVAYIPAHKDWPGAS